MFSQRGHQLVLGIFHTPCTQAYEEINRYLWFHHMVISLIDLGISHTLRTQWYDTSKHSKRRLDRNAVEITIILKLYFTHLGLGHRDNVMDV